MKYAADTVQTQTPQFMDLGFLNINSLDEISGLSTPAKRIRRPTDCANWSAPDHIFGEVTAVGVREAKSGHDHNYKIEFQICR